MISPEALTLSPALPLSELLDELPLRLRNRSSSGLPGDNPEARAKRLRTSVRLTTPERRPLVCAPAAGILVLGAMMVVEGAMTGWGEGVETLSLWLLGLMPKAGWA